MQNVLVTGGSGFLGGHLLRQLRAAGVTVRALARSDDSARAIEACGAIPVRGDVAEPAGLDAAFAEPVDAVFHAAADTNTWAPNDARQTRTNVGGTRALVTAALAHGVGAFLHTSSVSSFGHRVHEELSEDVPRLGGESWINYERTKFQAEEIVREGMARGLNAVIFHPAHIFGPGDTRNWARLIQMVDQGTLPGSPPGSGAFADVREVARAQVEGWRRQRYGEAYLLGGEHASFVDLIQRIGRLLGGRPTPRRATPAFALKLYAHALDLVSRVTGREPALTPAAAAFTCHELRVDSGKAMRELDYGITPLDRLLADTIASMREAGMLAAPAAGR